MSFGLCSTATAFFVFCFFFSSFCSKKHHGQAQRNQGSLAQRASHEHGRGHKRCDSPRRGRNQGEKDEEKKNNNRTRKARFFFLSLFPFLKRALARAASRFLNQFQSKPRSYMSSCRGGAEGFRKKGGMQAGLEQQEPRSFFFFLAVRSSLSRPLLDDLHLTFFFSLFSPFSSFEKKIQNRPPSRSARRPRPSTCLSKAPTGLPDTTRGPR